MKEWFSGIVRGKTTDSRGKDKRGKTPFHSGCHGIHRSGKCFGS